MTRLYFAMAFVVVGNVLGNVLLKHGSTAAPGQGLVVGLFGWQTIAGIVCFAAAVISNAMALRELPLHLAQAIAALQFVGAVAAAAVYFGETITAQKWLGIVPICVGLGFV